MPARGRPPTIGEIPTTGLAATISRRLSSARIGPIDTTGLEGQITTASARAIAASAPGAEADRFDVVPGAATDPVLLEVEVHLPSRRDHVEPGLHPSIGHREDRGLDPEPFGDPRGHRGEREPVRERACAEQMGPEVKVAQPEPGRLGVQGAELLGRPERLVAPAPSALALEDVAEPVDDRVEVRAHPEAVDVEVIAGVHDRRDVRRRKGAHETAQELPRADTAGERDDLHGSRA
jgi:hypothetical protein